MTNTGAFVCYNVFPGMSSKLMKKNELGAFGVSLMPRLGAARQNRQRVASASSHPSLGNSARLSRLKGHWAKPFRGVEAPQSLTSKFSEHRPVFFAQALIKSFQSKMGFSISSEDLQHNVDKSHRGQPGHGQISL